MPLLPSEGDAPMKQVDDLTRSLLAFDRESTLATVIELSNARWQVD
jgi:hypothetical protein